jgi:hypothetical protein
MTSVLNNTLTKIFKEKYKHVPLDDRKSVIHRLERIINEREMTGEYFSKQKVETELIPAFIKSYIRHRKTGYDDLMNRGVSKHRARQQVENYVRELYKYWTRRY